MPGCCCCGGSDSRTDFYGTCLAKRYPSSLASSSAYAEFFACCLSTSGLRTHAVDRANGGPGRPDESGFTPSDKRGEARQSLTRGQAIANLDFAELHRHEVHPKAHAHRRVAKTRQRA